MNRAIRAATLGGMALLAWLLLGGVGTASATTTLCDTSPAPSGNPLICPMGDEYGVDIAPGETLSGVLASDSPGGTGSGEAILSTGSGDIICSSSGFKAELDSDGTMSTGNGVTQLTFTNCSTDISGCSVNSVSSNPPFNATATYTNGSLNMNEDGKVDIVNPETDVNMTCFFIPVTCTYAGSDTVTGYLYNKNNANKPSMDSGAILDIDAQVNLTSGGGSCPASGQETVTYEVTGDEADHMVYITS